MNEPAHHQETATQHEIKGREWRIIITDLFMMAILLLNLGLIVFDWIFGSLTVQRLLAEYLPEFFRFYRDRIHADFLMVDLYFVAIFVVELLIRWALAAHRKTYHKWFFYPFIHWYDVLGCIPVGSLRFLRILRVVSIFIRLHRLEIIDITRSYLFRSGRKYYNILVEEISDRVVINVINGMQQEVREGGPVLDRIIHEAILPKRMLLAEWLAERIRSVSSHARDSYQDDIRRYVEGVVSEAVARNREIGLIDQVPIIGGTIAGTLEKTISDIVYKVIDNIIHDLASDQTLLLTDDLTTIVFQTLSEREAGTSLDEVGKDILMKSLDIIKAQVDIKQWKINEGIIPADGDETAPPEEPPA